MATPRPRYPASRRWLHWGIALLMVLAYVFVEVRENFERGSAERAAMLLAQPVLGLLTAWADGKTLLLPFTAVTVPALLAPGPDLAHALEDLHEWIGTAFYWVVGLHVAAALYHHFIRRDDTLRRMT